MATANVIVFSSLLFSTCFCLNIQDLGGEWVVREATGKYDNLRATVPGGIYTDLMNNGVIGDVFYGSNDTATRWVARSNWTYIGHFSVDENIVKYSKINLVFEGLDTFSTVLVNGVAVGISENMFIRYIFDVKEVLKRGDNTVEVRFVSPIATAESLSSQQAYTIPPSCPEAVSRGECHVNQIRKMQASFSWDWGPALPSMGIWKDVYLEAFDSSVIRYVLFDHEEAPGDSWMLLITTYLSAKGGETVAGKLVFNLETDVSVIQQIVDVSRTSNDNTDEVKVDFSFVIPKITVRPWWPNGYGEQKLYKFSAEFRSGSEVSTKSLKVGFRTIELIQDAVGSGLSFYFKVNGVPIFAKGANEIPLDVLPEKGRDVDTVSRILESAYAANMNMLRVWGGGVYESDYFYDKTDELGILVWQDFMFACAMYPSYPEFLNNVKSEIRHQVKRLGSHPSIALWAGNNENEIALMTNWYGLKNLSEYKSDYIKLYIDTVRSELLNASSNVIFVSSSPSNGKESEHEDYLSTNPGNPLYGDVHFYNYILNSLNTKTYPIPRFASEYGYQSLPSEDTWLTVTDNVTDLYPDTVFMDHRQHHPLGLIENNLLISYQLNLNRSVEDFYKKYIFYSQILQATSVKFETEYYRSFMDRLDSQGQGHTMGALFWQLNDVWVAPTWSSIDYTGKWKLLQYLAKDFFASTIITGHLDVSRQLQVYAVSEIVSLYGSAAVNLTASVETYNWTSFEVVNRISSDVSLSYGRSTQITVIDTDDYLSSSGCGALPDARKNCFFYLRLYSGNTIVAPPNFVLTTPLKDSNLQKTNVNISSIRQIDDKGLKFEIALSADGISLFVWLDSHRIRGRFSENGFLQVTPTKSITFVCEVGTDVSSLEKIITVVHLNDNQYQ